MKLVRKEASSGNNYGDWDKKEARDAMCSVVEDAKPEVSIRKLFTNLGGQPRIKCE
jgi:hypothetical protein